MADVRKISNENNAVDIQTIYESKENIQPIAKGRSASTLSNILKSDRKSRKIELDEVHSKFEKEIDESKEDDDPFKVYSDYIKWAIEAYPSGESHESNLVPLLERTTRNFKDDERYQRDIRYLRCWILYSKYVHEPFDIFRFLLANDIGTIWALLYEEAATAEEARGHRSKAGDLYLLGISRKAQPLDRLKRRYEDFKTRMANAPPLPSSSSSKKPMLGSSTIGTVSQSSSSQSQPKMSVFADDDPIDDNATWDKLGSRDDRRKENVVEKTSMKGETIQQGKLVTPKAEKVAIFTDDGADNPVFNDDNDQSSKLSSVPSEAELLRRNPFKNFSEPPKLDSESIISSVKQKSSEKRSKKSSSKSSSSSNVKGEPKVAVDLNKVYCDGTEFSFLEIKAKQMGLYGKKWPEPSPEDWDWKPNDKSQEIDDKPRKRAPSPTVNTKAALDDVMELFNQPLSCDRPASPSSDSDSDNSGQHSHLVMPTPTPARKAPPMMMYTDEHTARVPPTTFEDDDDDDENNRNNNNNDKAVYQDENAAATPAIKRNDENIGRTPLGAKPMMPLKQPVLSEKQPPIEEENNNKYEHQNESIVEYQEEQEEYIDEYIDDNEGQKQSRFPPISLMTPITERTCEFTQRVDTVERSCAQKQLGSVIYEDEDEDENENATEDDKKPPKLPSFEIGVDDEETQEINHTNKFELPEGFTINVQQAQDKEVDGDVEIIDKTNTMNVTNEGVMLIDAPNPCVAHNKNIIDEVLKKSKLSIFDLKNYYDFRNESLDELNKVEKALSSLKRRRNSKSYSNKSQVDDECYPLKLRKFSNEDDIFEVKSKIGEGGFGSVFFANLNENPNNKSIDLENWEEEIETDIKNVALKIEKPTNLWEFYMLETLHERLSERERRSIINPISLYAYSDESVLCLDYADQGTLLDVVNHAPEWFSSNNAGLDEVLVIFFTIELFRVIGSMHSNGIIHGDLKIDNCLIRLEDNEGEWSNIYNRYGLNGWNEKGLKIIDFGRAIDIKMFKNHQDIKFINDWNGDDKDCWQIKDKAPWSFEPDYFGLGAIIHCMLFGKYIETVNVNERIKLKNNLKRYWQHDLWSRIFDFLLNPNEFSENLPANEILDNFRVELEDWLEDNCHSKGRNLRFSVKMMERRCREMAKKKEVSLK